MLEGPPVGLEPTTERSTASYAPNLHHGSACFAAIGHVSGRPRISLSSGNLNVHSDMHCLSSSRDEGYKSGFS